MTKILEQPRFENGVSIFFSGLKIVYGKSQILVWYKFQGSGCTPPPKAWRGHPSSPVLTSYLIEFFISLITIIVLREKMYFTVQPESMLVKIEHAVLATKFLRGKGVKDLAASQRNMRGYLYSHNGTILKRQYNYLPVSSFQHK